MQDQPLVWVKFYLINVDNHVFNQMMRKCNQIKHFLKRNHETNAFSLPVYKMILCVI